MMAISRMTTATKSPITKGSMLFLPLELAAGAGGDALGAGIDGWLTAAGGGATDTPIAGDGDGLEGAAGDGTVGLGAVAGEV